MGSRRAAAQRALPKPSYPDSGCPGPGELSPRRAARLLTLRVRASLRAAVRMAVGGKQSTGGPHAEREDYSTP